MFKIKNIGIVLVSCCLIQASKGVTPPASSTCYKISVNSQDVHSSVLNCANKLIRDAGVREDQFPTQYKSEFDLIVSDISSSITSKMKYSYTSSIDYNELLSTVSSDFKFNKFIEKLKNVVPYAMLSSKVSEVASSIVSKNGLALSLVEGYHGAEYQRVKDDAFSKMDQMMRSDRRTFVRVQEIESHLNKTLVPMIDRIKPNYVSPSYTTPSYGEITYMGLSSKISEIASSILSKNGLALSIVEGYHGAEYQQLKDDAFAKMDQMMRTNGKNSVSVKDIESYLSGSMSPMIARLKTIYSPSSNTTNYY